MIAREELTCWNQAEREKRETDIIIITINLEFRMRGCFYCKFLVSHNYTSQKHAKDDALNIRCSFSV